METRVRTDETLALPIARGEGEVVYSDPFKRIEKHRVSFGTFAKEYYVTNYGERAAVVLTCEEKVCLTRQYRFVVDRISLEIPGGAVESGETFRDAAIRECLEETGQQCGEIERLIGFHPSLDATRNYSEIFHAEISERGQATEKVIWVGLEEISSMIMEQTIEDSLSIIGLLSYLHLRK